MIDTVTVDGISKQFRIGGAGLSLSRAARLRNMIRGDSSRRTDKFWALDNVSFRVAEGEIFGIIGRNGSGKSTLLKILTGIMRPTRGSATIRGRIGALLEVGTGFHPDLSGRENIYFNGALLGMSRSEINRKFDEIVTFADVDKFIDTQMKHYSSGMQARLGFAVAAHLRPDVLIVDEVLSVGDFLFQEKSLRQMGDLRKSGITMLFVSHNLSSVAALCERSMLLEHGKVKALGPTADVLDAYVPKFAGGKAHVDFPAETDKLSTFMSATLEQEDGTPCDQFDMAENVWLRVKYSVRIPLPGLQLSVRIYNNRDVLFQTDDTDEHTMLGVHPSGKYEKRLKIRKMFLKEGEYSVSILSGVPLQLLEDHENVLQFSVVAESLNTQNKSYRKERPGRVICQGGWYSGESALRS